ncbi:threonine/serine exporter family protein [Paenilisteria rocourtiae]|uniref:Uncharacterized membrane protein YjjP (DUF1212 family) n=1 Tax=Listeria rocourtiae TaxID=647910 RepID=A0A4R6ZSK5_9LIST|nr:threonine/serine exporter family protein [Listeria rocourtiae]TDR55585.1 uncharacterized membrane protein YjjP (DUF1212 family) [Listeria rocourtiae]
MTTDDKIFISLISTTGKVLLAESGEGTIMIEKQLHEISELFGYQLNILCLSEYLEITVYHGDEHIYHSIIQATPGIASLSRISAVKTLLYDINSGLTLEKANEKIQEIATAPAIYPAWLRVIGTSFFAMGFAPLVFATWTEIWINGVLGLVSGLLCVVLEKTRFGILFPLIASFTIGIIALTFFYDTAMSYGPVFLIIPALFICIPRDTMSAAAGEIFYGKLTAGSARLISAFMCLLQMVIGILLAMEITNVTSHALDKGDIANTLNPVFLLLFIIVFCFGLCLTFNVPMSYLTRLALFAILTYGVQFGFSQLSGDLIGTFVAAIVAGVLSNIYTKSPSQPPRVVLFISSFFILTVGSMGIEGLSSIIGGYVVEGTREVISMIILFPTVTIGIAIGYLISTQKKQMQQKN